MRPKLELTNAGITAFVGTNALTISHFLCGSSYDENNQNIQDETPFQFDIAFQRVYIKGQQYQKDGVTVTEDYNHIKIVGYLSASDITFNETGEYTVREIALIGTINNENIVLAYGWNGEGITLYEGNQERYIIKLDIICENTPNIVVNNSTAFVNYNDFLDHKDKIITSDTPIHGITFDNQDLKINNVGLDMCKNTIFQKTTGATVVDSLPTASTLYNEKLVYNKTTASLYKCSKTTEIEVGDYIYQDQNDIWQVGDGTETGALEVVADSATPTNTEIKLAQAQNHFMEWNSVNNIDKRLSLVENVSLGGITDIIDTLQNQIASINNALSNPFPAWGAETIYAVGDICICSTFDSYKYLECVVAGTTGTTPPANANVGQLITDNTVKWLVCDWRDSNPVGTIKQDLVVRDGYVLLNGRALNTADYPRLVKFLEDNNLILNYNDSHRVNLDFYYANPEKSVFLIPNFLNKFIENDLTALNRKDAGLPNITGSFKLNVPITSYTANRDKITVDTVSGAFEKGNSTIATYPFASTAFTGSSGATDNSVKNVDFKASNSNSIYGNSNTVQPPAITLIPIIKY